MDRRKFFSQMVGGLAATAAVRTWPFRVYSFPKEIVIPYSLDSGATWNPVTFDGLCVTTLADLRENVIYDHFFIDTPWINKLKLNGNWKDYEDLG